MTTPPTPEQIAQQLYAINEALILDQGSLTPGPDYAPTQWSAIMADINNQSTALQKLMQALNTEIQNTPDSPQKQALMKLRNTIADARADLICASADLQGGQGSTSSLATAAQALWSTDQSSGGVADVAEAYRITAIVAVDQIDEARQAWDFNPSGSAANFTALLTAFQTFLNGTPPPPLGLSTAQMASLNKQVKAVLGEIITNPTPTQIKQLNADWSKATALIQQIPTLGSESATQGETS